MKDRILESMKAGFLVVWEEIARDGAQGKVLMSAASRVKTARMIGNLFGDSGPDHLVFAAGYPAIGKDEYEAVVCLAGEVDNCALATHGRMLRDDIDLGIDLMSRAAYGRASFAVPISEQYSRAMMGQDAAQTLQQGLDLARYALDKAGGVPVDVAFGGASIEDPSFIADAANAFFEEGIATVKLCDSVGCLYPFQADKQLRIILQGCHNYVRQLGVHLHNDLGLALATTIDSIAKGIRMACASWLGIGERIGLAATEQLIFNLTHPQKQLPEKTGIPYPLWKTPPHLPGLQEISKYLSRELNYPLRATDPVNSPAINDISTGAYMNKPGLFKPFDPESVLGVPPKLVLTHLANKKIIKMAAKELGTELGTEQLETTMVWVKRYAYENNISKIPLDQFKLFIDNLSNE